MEKNPMFSDKKGAATEISAAQVYGRNVKNKATETAHFKNISCMLLHVIAETFRERAIKSCKIRAAIGGVI
jgi:hypothetical protein